MARTSALARPLTDPEESRQCIEERGARPARVQGGDTHAGLIRFDFPDTAGNSHWKRSVGTNGSKSLRKAISLFWCGMTPPPAKEGHRPAPHVLEGKPRRKLQREATRELAANQLIALGAYSRAGRQPDIDVNDRARSCVVGCCKSLRHIKQAQPWYPIEFQQPFMHILFLQLLNLRCWHLPPVW